MIARLLRAERQTGWFAWKCFWVNSTHLTACSWAYQKITSNRKKSIIWGFSKLSESQVTLRVAEQALLALYLLHLPQTDQLAHWLIVAPNLLKDWIWDIWLLVKTPFRKILVACLPHALLEESLVRWDVLVDSLNNFEKLGLFVLLIPIWV